MAYLCDVGDVTLHTVDTKQHNSNISIQGAQCELILSLLEPTLRVTCVGADQGMQTTGKRKKSVNAGWAATVVLTFRESNSSVDVSFGWIIIEPDRKENPNITRILMRFETTVTTQSTWWKALQQIVSQEQNFGNNPNTGTASSNTNTNSNTQTNTNTNTNINLSKSKERDRGKEDTTEEEVEVSDIVSIPPKKRPSRSRSNSKSTTASAASTTAQSESLLAEILSEMKLLNAAISQQTEQIKQLSGDVALLKQLGLGQLTQGL